MRIKVLILLLFITCGNLFAGDFSIVKDNKIIPLILLNETECPVDAALDLLKADFLAVTDTKPEVTVNTQGFNLNYPCVLIGTLGKNKKFDRFLRKNKVETQLLESNAEAYRIQYLKAGMKTFLLVLGGDSHGTAFGLMELSRFIGVSPWVWWADAIPEKKHEILYPLDKVITSFPSVRYRGIFLNDEDWGLMPWATKTLDPESKKGAIGPKAYERICQLLLRLKSNILWPAMHECTIPFYLVPGNAEAAKKYGIYIGTSHCEPLLCNIAGEWNAERFGPYNYAVNADTIKAYWKKRVESTRFSPGIYTIGMRGQHDGKMQGAETVEEQRVLLQKVINDQRNLLGETIKKPLSEIPQVFIPYKEVLEVYDSGLKVPEDITLIWCDDNYGYMSRLNNSDEALRSGGSGVYYHISYWGRPHDYLWLASTNPALIKYEMTRAWDTGARKLWVVNVGDIKPAEYLTEYYLDLAWNVGKIPEESDKNKPPYSKHLNNFFAREFGAEYAGQLSEVMQDYYSLANQRKPEHMAWTRVEESAFPRGRSPIADTEFNKEEALLRIKKYTQLENKVRMIEERLAGADRASFYQLVSYPVYGASLINQKLLYAQLSRQHFATDSVLSREYAAASRYAYDEIQRLSDYYNKGMSNGKWNLMISSRPRDLYVFDEPVLPEAFKSVKSNPLLTPRVVLRSADITRNHIAINASVARPNDPISGLGHSGSAVILKKGESLNFNFETKNEGPAELRIYTLPKHAIDGGNQRYKVILDNLDPVEMNIRTIGRSEEWKLNVLRNQAIRKMPVQILKTGNHSLKITAIDDDIVLDQIQVEFNPKREFYLVD